MAFIAPSWKSLDCENICAAMHTVLFQPTLVQMLQGSGMKHAQAISLGGILQLAHLILFSSLGFCEDCLHNIYMTY